jgi:hypothetical protein
MYEHTNSNARVQERRAVCCLELRHYSGSATGRRTVLMIALGSRF